VPRAQVAGVVPGRRPVVGALGLAGGALALGAAYWLGLRHGRTELRIEAGGGAMPERATALALVDEFHAFSAHSRLGVLRRAPGSDWGDPPPPFKTHAGVPRMPLAPAWRRMDDVTPLRDGLDAPRLGTLLWMVAGVSEWRGGIPFRTAPSSGALFATELYLQTPGPADERHGDRLPAGLWHYDPQSHGLERLPQAGPERPGWPGATAPPAGALAAVVATAIFRRSGHKYRDRTYRYILADLGHALENLRVAAAALGLHVQFETAFDDAPWSEALALDAAEEGVLALAWLLPAHTATAAPGTLARPGPHRVPLPQAGARLGLTDAVHRATSLRALAPAPALAPALSQAAPAPAAPTAPDVLAVLATRRSQRRYADAALPRAALMALATGLAGPGPLLSPALRVHVIAHRVDGLEAGAWRWDPARQRFERSPDALASTVASAAGVRELRRRSRAAGLDQDVIADAAAVFVFTIARTAWTADPAGPARGYRHAFLEAGLAGERLYLAAPAFGLGVCAVGAFYDDETAALVGIESAEEWPVHFAAVGPV
jgi:SagB-type dehydrogenase family enzyme